MIKEFVSRLKKHALLAIILIVPIFVFLIAAEFKFQANDNLAKQKAIAVDTAHCTNVLHGKYSIDSRTGYCHSEDGTILKKYTYW